MCVAIYLFSPQVDVLDAAGRTVVAKTMVGDRAFCRATRQLLRFVVRILTRDTISSTPSSTARSLLPRGTAVPFGGGVSADVPSSLTRDARLSRGPQVGCPNLPPRLAHAKATLCVSTHMVSSRAVRDKYQPTKTPQLIAMTVIGAANEMQCAAVPGGLLLRDAEGRVLGAIAVSGAAADEDEHCAVVAALAVGLITVPSPLA
jgi:uncharacterized protein GlcG (DUF336 family)